MANLEKRDVIGIFYLALTTILGAYILIFGETLLLPISKEDANSAFQIIIPTFIAQLTIIFKWYVDPNRAESLKIKLPRWVIYGPPISVTFVIVLGILVIVDSAGESFDGGSMFKNVVTFCVSILGATTVFVVGGLFGTSDQSSD